MSAVVETETIEDLSRYEGISVIYPPEVLREMLRLYEDEGLSRREIARLYTVETSTVGRYLHHMGAKMRPPGGSRPGQHSILKPGQLYQMKYLYLNKGLFQREIAEMLGLKSNTVSKHLSRIGVRKRTRREIVELQRQRKARSGP